MTLFADLAPYSRPRVERQPIRVLVIDAHPIAGWGLALMADREADLRVVGVVDELDAAMPLLADRRPDVVTLAVDTDYEPVELSRLPAVLARFPGLHVVVLASEPDPDLLLHALDMGASAVLLKADPVADILSALSRVARRDPRRQGYPHDAVRRTLMSVPG